MIRSVKEVAESLRFTGGGVGKQLPNDTEDGCGSGASGSGIARVSASEFRTSKSFLKIATQLTSDGGNFEGWSRIGRVSTDEFTTTQKDSLETVVFVTRESTPIVDKLRISWRTCQRNPNRKRNKLGC
ncbi:UNVERIFIED_CONTAM: hypothetical protein HDU68_012224 [Siphonaria sp. JEL0065]|nr:hypothetical protein HDU68_012224 [Siphonaria sp. JEL0065]